MRRKILMGVFALALPIGTIVGLSTAASAGKVTRHRSPHLSASEAPSASTRL